MVWVATIVIGAALVVSAGITAWSTNQSQINQQKRQAGLLKDAESKERQDKAEIVRAKAESEKAARAQSLHKQRAASETVLTGATGLEEEDQNLAKKKLLGA